MSPDICLACDILRRNPLHLAIIKGQLDSPDICLACDILRRNPLHLAIIKGQLDVLKDLILVVPQVIRECMDFGDIVLHLCVKHNRLEVFKYLVDEVVNEEALNEKDTKGNTIWHLAMANKQVGEIVAHQTKLPEDDCKRL
ncbi:hypothetical protein Ancab_001903 [Ancistrocladus abbreviatus]